MRVALVSLDQIWEDKEANRISCKDYIEKAASLNVDLIVFPEMTLTGFSMNTQLIREKRDQSLTLDFFSNLAKQRGIAVAFGVVFEKQEKATNNLIVLDKKGNLLSSYEKIHPFSFSGENNFYLGGDEIVTCTIDEATVGLTICYDLRFPEIFQALSKTCNVIITIANWPEKRILHWNTLLQARSIENQSFIIGVNRIGLDGNNHRYVRSSSVFDPTGDKLEPTHSYEDMETFNISLENVLSTRESFPVKQDRKIQFYKSIL